MLLQALLILPAMPVSLEKRLYGKSSGTGNGARRMRRGRRKALRETNIDALRAVDSCKCFVAGTKVKTPSGYRNIENIRARDEVLSYNETTKRLEVQTVKQTFIRLTDCIYTLVYDTGTKLQTTATHPFYIEGKGWVKAADLHVGDDSLLSGEVSPLDIYGGARLQNVSYRQSKQGVIVGITVEDRAETVYNFEVNETHTYLVGDADVVVHNSTCFFDKGQGLAQVLDEYNKQNPDNQIDLITFAKRRGYTIYTDKDGVTRIDRRDGRAFQPGDAIYIDDGKNDRIGPVPFQQPAQAEFARNEDGSIKRDSEGQPIRNDTGPVVGKDFVSGKEVRAPTPGTQLPDITSEVDARMEWFAVEAQNATTLSEYIDLVRRAFPQNGVLDFKNTILNDEQNEFTSSAIYNGKIVQAPDLGNMAYGWFFNYLPRSIQQNGSDIINRIDHGIQNGDPKDDTSSIDYGRKCSTHFKLIRKGDSNAGDCQ